MEELIKRIKENYPECKISELKNKKMDINIKTTARNMRMKGIEVNELADRLGEEFNHLDITVNFIISE